MASRAMPAARAAAARAREERAHLARPRRGSAGRRCMVAGRPRMCMRTTGTPAPAHERQHAGDRSGPRDTSFTMSAPASSAARGDVRLGGVDRERHARRRAGRRASTGSSRAPLLARPTRASRPGRVDSPPRSSTAAPAATIARAAAAARAGSRWQAAVARTSRASRSGRPRATARSSASRRRSASASATGGRRRAAGIRP